jgi:regulator of protease activity HflC (stomatin/prohibitin superfamily)
MSQEIRELQHDEKSAPFTGGMSIMIVNIALYILALLGFIWGVNRLESAAAQPEVWVEVPVSAVEGAAEVALITNQVTSTGPDVMAIAVVTATSLYFVLGWIIFVGLKVLKPNEAYVLTLFGKYYGTLRGPGFFFVNPFVTSTAPENAEAEADSTVSFNIGKTSIKSKNYHKGKKISLKALTLNNDKQKINDLMGNPIEIGIVVIWRVINTAKAVFNVDNYPEYLSMQCDSALRSIVRMYPYDVTDAEGESSLRGSSEEVSSRLQAAIQEKVEIAGLEITEARITHLAYAPEIAAAMLQRQQASAIIDARTMIVDGAVGMVELALDKLSSRSIVDLDEERKAAMVSNLLVVLCGSKDAQPIVNSGTLY